MSEVVAGPREDTDKKAGPRFGTVEAAWERSAASGAQTVCWCAPVRVCEFICVDFDYIRACSSFYTFVVITSSPPPLSFRLCFHNVNALRSYRLGYVIGGCTGWFVFWMDTFGERSAERCSTNATFSSLLLAVCMIINVCYELKHIDWQAACGWAKCKWCFHKAWMECPSCEKKLHTSLIPVFLDILLSDELKGTCLVCEWALSTAWCQKLSFYQHRGVQELQREIDSHYVGYHGSVCSTEYQVPSFISVNENLHEYIPHVH